MAVSILTGKFVWLSDGYFAKNDVHIFQTAGLADMFGIDDEIDRRPRRGLADRAYYSTNPRSILNHCLLASVKVNRDEVLSERDRKWNQVIATVRIEVERAIGRLKCQKRISEAIFRAKGNREIIKEKHGKIFKICVHFTNFWMNMYPLRQQPHWLLCKGEIKPKMVDDIVARFLASRAGLNFRDFLKTIPEVKDLHELYPVDDEE